jgi:amino acid adenylation domain-containing protein
MSEFMQATQPNDRKELLKNWLARPGEIGNDASIPLARRDQALRMSSGQRRLYIQEHVNNIVGDLNVPIAWRIRGALDVEALFQAIDLIIVRHEVLRTSFYEEDGEFYQKIHPAAAMPRKVEVLPKIDGKLQSASLRHAIEVEAYAPFDMSRAPMIHAKVFVLDDNDHILLMALPHIVMDGVSMNNLHAELEAAYRPGDVPDVDSLPLLPLQYADFAEAQRARVSADGFAKKLEFWRSQLSDAPLVLPLPTDRPRQARRSYPARWHRFVFEADVVAGIEAISGQEKASTFMVLLATYQWVLARWTNCSDIVVGSPVSGRNHASLEPLIGFFVNTLPLRTRVDHSWSFRELVQDVRKTVIASIEHQDVPYDVMVQEFALGRSTSVNALVQAEISYIETGSVGLELRGVHSTAFEIQGRATRNDLVMAFNRDGASLRCDLVYDTELFDASTIASFLKRFDDGLRSALRHPDLSLRALPLQETVMDGGAVAPDAIQTFDSGLTLFDCVRVRAEVEPNMVAMLSGDMRMSYAQLLRRVDQLADELLTRGIGPERVVAAHMSRSPWLVISLLATWKVGGVWAPVDAGQKGGQIDAILECVKPALVLRIASNSESVDELPRLEFVLGSSPSSENAIPSQRPHTSRYPDALAYIISTSGTTGKPKGVGISYRNVAHLIDALKPLASAPGAVSANVLAPSFDGWLWSTILPLAHGGGLSLVDPVDAGDELFAQPSAVVTLTPSLLATVSEVGPCPGTIVVAGEAAPAGLIERWQSRTRLVNAYGPTETTICATWADAGAGDDPATIGFNIARCRTYVLDSELQPIADGMPGELFIGGAGVGRGYINMPGVTAAKFLPDPFSSGDRMYRSGDLVRRLPDGSLEFLGRLDAQIKIRGFRIEPTALARAAETVEGVGSAVAFAVQSESGAVLCLAISHTGSTARVVERVRLALAETLPDFMQPTHVLAIEDMPLTLAGKIDVKALEAMIVVETSQTAQCLPATPSERLVARIWSEMLGRSVTETDRSFFELGGHSLLAARVVSALRKETGVKLSIRDMLSKPTVAASAEAIDRLLVLQDVK